MVYKYYVMFTCYSIFIYSFTFYISFDNIIRNLSLRISFQNYNKLLALKFDLSCAKKKKKENSHYFIKVTVLDHVNYLHISL